MLADAEADVAAPPKVRRSALRRGSAEVQDLRVSLETVDDTTARALLGEFGPTIRALVRAYLGRARSTFYVVSEDELRLVAEAAVLEAWVRYREGDTSKEGRPGAGFRSWVRRFIRYRLRDHVMRVADELPGVGADARADAHNGALHGHVTDEAPPIERVYREEMRAWTRAALGRLDTRARTILVALVFEGEPRAAVASSLGLSVGRIDQIYFATLAKLQAMARADGFDGFEVGP